jgi:hypothetical protein
VGQRLLLGVALLAVGGAPACGDGDVLACDQTVAEDSSNHVMDFLGGRAWRAVDDATLSPAEEGVVVVMVPDDSRPIRVNEQEADGIEEALADDDLELWIGRLDETHFASMLSLDVDGSVRLYGNCAHEVWADQIDEFLDDRRDAIDEQTPADVVRTLMTDQDGDLADEYDDWLNSSESAD